MSKGQKTRQRIIREAATLFNTKGYAGSSVSDLLEATGIKKGGLYRHFQSKEEIALKAFDYAWSLAWDSRQQAIDAEAAPKTQLRQFIHSFCQQQEGLVPGGCPLLNTAIETDDGNPALRRKAQEALQNWRAFLEGLIRKSVRDNELSGSVEPQAVASCIIAMLEGAVMISCLSDNRTALETAGAFWLEWIESHSMKENESECIERRNRICDSTDKRRAPSTR